LGIVGHDRAFPLLFFDDFVEHAVVVSLVVLVGKDVLNLNLTEFLTGRMLVVGHHGEVKEGGVIVRLDHDGDVAYTRKHRLVFYDGVHLCQNYGYIGPP
jgi:hypothetical protein